MNTQHLGDAYDYVKKVILETLKKGLQKKIYVLPMFTDTFNDERLASNYEQTPLAFYKNLTSCDEIEHRVILKQQTEGNIDDDKWIKRTEYFDNRNLDHYIVFIDPDKGINGKGHKYVSYEEIANVARDNNILVVYDESFTRAKHTEKVREVQQKIAEIEKTGIEKTGIHCFYLNLNKQLCFAFISKDKNLLEKAKELLIKRNVALLSRLIPEENSSQVEPPQEGLGE